MKGLFDSHAHTHTQHTTKAIDLNTARQRQGTSDSAGGWGFRESHYLNRTQRGRQDWTGEDI